MDKDLIIREYLAYLQGPLVITESDILFLQESAVVSRMVKSINTNIEKTITKVLRRYNIAVEAIKKDAKKYPSKVKALYDRNVPPEKASVQISKMISKDIANYLKKASNNTSDLFLDEKILLSILIFILLLFFNTFMINTIALIIDDPEIAMAIGAIVVGPLTEEAIKNYFIQEGMPWMGTGIVFGLELLHYVLRFIYSGMKIGKFVLIRLASLLLHFTTTFVQKKIIESADEDDPDQQLKRAWIAYAVGVGIHALWNTMGLVYNEKLVGWAKK